MATIHDKIQQVDEILREARSEGTSDPFVQKFMEAMDGLLEVVIDLTRQVEIIEGQHQ